MREILIKISVMSVIILFLSGCVGYSVYDDSGHGNTDKNDDSGLFYDVTGTLYMARNNYTNMKISKQDVISAWGEPVSIKEYRYNFIYGNTSKAEPTYEKDEVWVYNTGISIGGFAPIIIVPIPIFWWPTGFSNTFVYFQDGDVSSVYIDAGKMTVECLMILPIVPICLTGFLSGGIM